MPMKIQAVRGMRDVLPGEVETWQAVERVARKVFEAYGFSEIRIPVVEKTELFARSIGQATDIVEKEMYTFSDRGGLSLSLRPEATAGILRACIEHSLFSSEPVHKLYCIGPMFRRERPQKGRHRQFHQIDAELLGASDPRADAEVLAMLRMFFSELGVVGLEFQINSLGCAECRPAFRAAVSEFLRGREGDLCPDCQRRLGLNPLRVYDCKVERCRDLLDGAPRILDRLCPQCLGHFDAVRNYMELLGIPHCVNPHIVRGLDYYTRTTFEVVSNELGAQNALCGGGRYDRLVHELGGPQIPGIGFAIGEERLVSVLMARRPCPGRPLGLFVVGIGPEAARDALVLVERARKVGLRTELDLRGGSLKAQLRRADKLGARRALILGPEELASGWAPWRDMESGVQAKVSLDGLGDLFAQWAREDRERDSA